MKFLDNDFIACLCEGNAEKAVIDILLENDLLKFRKKQLLEEKSLKIRNAKTFANTYLGKTDLF